MPSVTRFVTASISLVLSIIAARRSHAEVEVLGIPVKSTMISATAAGLNEKGEGVFYFSCSQPGNHLLLVEANPKTGSSRQWSSPVGEGAWAMAVAADHRVYLGTWESGYLLRFDPKHPEKGIESLGKPSASETYIWQVAVGKDGAVYGCTYPHAKLVRYDPATAKSEDLGRLDPNEMYARSVATDSNGFVYVGIGTKRAQVVRFDPQTGKSNPLLADSERPTGTAQVFRGEDGNVYATIGGKYFRCGSERLESLNKAPTRESVKLQDGTTLISSKVDRNLIHYETKSAEGKIASHDAKFDGSGLSLFQVGAGPGGTIFGSTALPLEMFEFDPKAEGSARLRDLGNPTDVGGEIYSFTSADPLLYVCAYPGSFLSVFDPTKPWHYGKAKDSNPRGIGPMGDGHLRPRALLTGPDGRIYVGSLPPYGQTGGALGIYDPVKDAVTENYRHVVTNQGITSLTFAADGKTLFGGTSTEAGGGGTVIAKQAVVFAWDVNGKRKLWETNVVAKDTLISGLAFANGKLFGVSLPSNTLFALNPTNQQALFTSRIAFGRFHETCLAYSERETKLVGLAGNTIFSVDPKSYEFTKLGESKEPIRCGFAVTATGIYFGSGAKLCRWTGEF